MKTTEKVKFRLIEMPCCGQLLCWINPRLPTYCPECGKLVFAQIKPHILFTDDEALLKYNKSEGSFL